MPISSCRTVRRSRAVETFKTASDCIGKISKGMGLFAMTRGQFSMIDAVFACLDQMGPSNITAWTWTVAEYEMESMEKLMRDGRVTGGTLIIDHGARQKNRKLLQMWQSTFGKDSVRYVVNHAKIVTLQSDDLSLLMRGSFNLNFNPRFEQFDITEGGEDFDLVREIEGELPILSDYCSGAEPVKASKLGNAFSLEQLDMFKGAKVWAK